MASNIFNTYTNGDGSYTTTYNKIKTLTGDAPYSLVFDKSRHSIWTQGTEYGYSGISNITTTSSSANVDSSTLNQTSGKSRKFVSGVSLTTNENGTTLSYTYYEESALNINSPTGDFISGITVSGHDITLTKQSFSNSGPSTGEFLTNISISSTGALSYTKGNQTTLSVTNNSGDFVTGTTVSNHQITHSYGSFDYERDGDDGDFITNISISTSGLISYTEGNQAAISISKDSSTSGNIVNGFSVSGTRNHTITYKMGSAFDTINTGTAGSATILTNTTKLKVLTGISGSGNQISYAYSEINTTHSGSISGNFVYAVSLSADGVLGGTAGTFDPSIQAGTTNTDKVTITIGGYISSEYTIPYATKTTTATNIAGGAAGSLPYQSDAGTTTFLAKGSNDQLLILSNGVPAWTNQSNIDAGKLDGYDSSDFQLKVGANGSTYKPLYTSSDGTFSECSTYAGGTNVTLNGTNTSGSTASLYAPTGAGSSNQVLISNGSGAPSWTNQSNIDAGKLDGYDSSDFQLKVGAKGSTTKPLYTSAAGTFAECSNYAGGTNVTLNGTNASGSTASFYAPTGAGSSNQVLISNGSGAPSWTNQSSLSVGSATTASTAGGLTNAINIKIADHDYDSTTNPVTGHISNAVSTTFGSDTILKLPSTIDADIVGNASTATSLAGGASGSIPYQSAANTTSFLAKGSNGQVLKLSDGIPTWGTDNNDDTKNTAGSTNDTSKLFIIGAKTQGDNPVTFSNVNVYISGSELYSNGSVVLTSHQDISAYVNAITSSTSGDYVKSITKSGHTLTITYDSFSTVYPSIESKNTNTAYNLLFTDQTSGSLAKSYVSTGINSLTWNPSNGTLHIQGYVDGDGGRITFGDSASEAYLGETSDQRLNLYGSSSIDLNSRNEIKLYGGSTSGNPGIISFSYILCDGGSDSSKIDIFTSNANSDTYSGIRIDQGISLKTDDGNINITGNGNVSIYASGAHNLNLFSNAEVNISADSNLRLEGNGGARIIDINNSDNGTLYLGDGTYTYIGTGIVDDEDDDILSLYGRCGINLYVGWNYDNVKFQKSSNHSTILNPVGHGSETNYIDQIKVDSATGSDSHTLYIIV